jgi:acylphosphatase
LKSIHAIISGKVQGVFFRDSTCKEAKRLSITGWVRNNLDGTVELKATGDTNKIEAFEGWLHKGPPHARVDRVICKNIAIEPFDTFSIK